MDLKKDISPSTVSRNGVEGSGLSRSSIVLGLALTSSSSVLLKATILGSRLRGSQKCLVSRLM